MHFRHGFPQYQPARRTHGWGGTFRPDEITTDLRNAVEGLQLELPYDRMRTVAVTGIRKLLARQVLMSLAGRGPAPF